MEMFNCTVTESAIYSATKTLQSGRLSEGEKVKAFERALSEQLGLLNPVCTNSGTSALHLALKLAGVGSGDEVILPAQTFIATGLAVLYCGATPVFVDVDPETGLLNTEGILDRCNSKTAAVILVDWCGLPCDFDDLSLVSSVWSNMWFIEDAAQALGARYKGAPIGSGPHVSVSCFSFQATKHLTTGDGGAISMWNRHWSLRARRLRWFGMDRDDPLNMGEREAVVYDGGYKYHMNDVAASIGLGNLYGFGARLHRRQVIGNHYREALQGIPGLKVPPMPTDRTHAYYAFPLLVERREDFYKALPNRGVPSSVISRRIDRHPIFGGLREDLPGTEYYDAHQINLPCHDGLTDDDVGKVVEAVKRGW